MRNGGHMLERLLQDIRFGVRTMRRNPAVTAAAVLSMALGIGANTAVFTMLNAVLWRTLPVADPSALVEVRAFARDTGREAGVRTPVLRWLDEQRDAFAGVAAYESDGLACRFGNRTERVVGEVVTANYFSVMGVRPFLGSYFREGQDRAGWEPVVVLSHDFFVRRLVGDRGAIGSLVYLNGYAFRVIGIAPSGFHGYDVGGSPDLWMPMMLEPGLQARMMPALGLLDQSSRNMTVLVARLRPGVTREQAQTAAELAVQRGWPQVGEPGHDAPRLRLTDGSRGLLQVPSWLQRYLSVMIAGTALLLAIACVNVANLLLARAVARQREMGVRLAIGANRGRVMRQLLTESVVIASIGCGLGLIVAYWAAGGLLALLPQGSEPLVLETRPDTRILVFTVAVSLLTAIAFGLAPAVQALRVDPLVSLRAESSGGGVSRAVSRLRRATVVAQVALALVLTVGAGLLTRSLQHVRATQAGYADDEVVLFSTKPVQDGGVRYSEAQLWTLFDVMLRDVGALPGVAGVTAIGSGEAIAVPGTSVLHGRGPVTIGKDDGTTTRVPLVQDWVSPSFFQTFRMSALAGRVFTETDDAAAPPVVVITDALARALFGATSPIGRRIRMSANPGARAFEIVGVVASAPYDSARTPGTAVCLFPFAQGGKPVITTLVVRAAGGHAGGLIPTVERALHAIDRDLPVFNVRTAGTQRDRDLAKDRLLSILFRAFGVLALVLATIGLYGVLAYAVAQRTTEIGLRMALGAERGAIERLVFANTLRLVLLGLAIGLPLAYGAARLAASELNGVAAHDPLVLGGSVLLILGIGLFAGWLPARRAAGINPIVALRSM